MDVAGARERGEAAGILTTTRQVGGAIGLAAMSAVFVAVGQEQPDRTSIGNGLEAALLLAAGVCAVTAVTTFVLLRGPRARALAQSSSG